MTGGMAASEHAHNARNAVTTTNQNSLRTTFFHGGERDLLPSPPTSNTPPPAPALSDETPQWPSPFSSTTSAYSARHSSSPLTFSPFIGSRSQHSSGSSRRSGAGLGMRILRRTRTLRRGAVAGKGYATPAPVNGSATGTTAQYAPGTSSPTPQYVTPQYTTLGATPRTLTARYEYLGGQAQGAGQGVVGQQDLYFYTLTTSPVSSASTSSSFTTSESCSASEESTSEEEEKRYDAPAYTERTTDFATRHTPATADFAQSRAHRPIAYLSSPASAASDDGRESDEGDTEMHADRHAADTQHSSGHMRSWAAEQARRMRRLRIVPADPSAHAYRPQQQSQSQSQQLQTQYGYVGGGGTRGHGACRACGRRLCGWEVVAAEVSRGGAADGSVSGWGAAAAVDAPDAAHGAPACPGAPGAATAVLTAYAATPATQAPTARRPGSGPARAYDDAWTPPRAAYAAAGHGQWTPPRLPRFADLEQRSPGVGEGEVVPSHAPQVPSHAPQGLAHTHVPSHTLPQLAPLAQAPMPHRAVFANAGSPGMRVRIGVDRQVTPPVYVLLAGYPTVPPSSRSTDTDMHRLIFTTAPFVYHNLSVLLHTHVFIHSCTSFFLSPSHTFVSFAYIFPSAH
ncbi:hypothetical protein C8J57DRAFT_1726225 [Mycena rebaudengoi]|nr:hypothetical protein C8J57DRAFT_1726225 [Mycena rebaudengoi]